jgi:subtilisin family serine protease
MAVAIIALAPGASARHAEAGSVVPGRYVVLLKAGAGSSGVAALANSLGLTPAIEYNQGVPGFAAPVPDGVLERLRADPAVLSIEPDTFVSAALHENAFQTLPTGVDRIDAETYAGAGIGAPPGPNVNADVAVIDSGIDIDHPDLNVVGGARFTGLACSGGSYDDDYSHGTHVAGTIAARDDDRGVVGVAPGARLWAVKVLDSQGVGYTSCVISGLNWVAGRKAEFNDGPGDGDPGINILVANMSLGGSTSGALCAATANVVAQGVIVPVAAGNEAADAGTSGPANCSEGITVSAFADFDGASGGFATGSMTAANCTETQDDSFACFSNYGSQVEIAAPGVDIVSTLPGGLYGWGSGTSMATPHVAGALALFRAIGGYAGPANGPIVMSALTAGSWTEAQNSTCGFTGDPDSVREPLLHFGGLCFGDRDGDGVLDESDNCPDWPNAGGALPTWPVPAGDSDCDGFSTAKEAPAYNKADKHCAATAAANDETYASWPPDNDDSQTANLADVVRMGPSYNAAAGDPDYDARFDLNSDARVSLSDVITFGPFFNKNCSS